MRAGGLVEEGPFCHGAARTPPAARRTRARSEIHGPADDDQGQGEEKAKGQDEEKRQSRPGNPTQPNPPYRSCHLASQKRNPKADSFDLNAGKMITGEHSARESVGKKSLQRRSVVREASHAGHQAD